MSSTLQQINSLQLTPKKFSVVTNNIFPAVVNRVIAWI